jgi:hypothetical protein
MPIGRWRSAIREETTFSTDPVTRFPEIAARCESVFAREPSTAMSLQFTRLLFGIAGFYDFVIGLVFLFLSKPLFDANGIPYPNHWGYLQFGALLLVLFGLMFFDIARNPVANRNLIPYGILLKISYIVLVVYYSMVSNCPFLFQPFAVIDAVMLILFCLAYFRLSRLPSTVGPTQQ